MRKSARSNAHQDKRQRAKRARAVARHAQSLRQAEKQREKRVARFRKSGMQQIQLAMSALLEGAKRAGVDINLMDLQGRIDSKGEGRLEIDDRVPPDDVRRAEEEGTAWLKEQAALEAARPVRHVDGATEVPPELRDGSKERPFKTVQEAMDAQAGGEE
jgi:hypothetical protein